MSAFTLLLITYALGTIIIGVPMGTWSLCVWRHPNKNRVFSFLLFPFHRIAEFTDFHGQQFIGNHWDSLNMLVLMVSERDISNACYEEDAEARLKCARYVVATALLWLPRLTYLLTVNFLSGVFFGLVFIGRGCNWLLDLAGKLFLRHRHGVPF